MGRGGYFRLLGEAGLSLDCFGFFFWGGRVESCFKKGRVGFIVAFRS